MKYLSLDIGTTCCKYQVFDESGNILAYVSEEYALKNIDGETYVDVDGIWQRVKAMIKNASLTHDISSVCISTIGESFVVLDDNDNVIFYPMLYTDNRGEAEADEVLKRFGGKYLFNKVGVLPQSMYSVYKLLWIKNNKPEIYKKAKKVMLMCDYMGFKLTGECVIDYGLASRTGAFNVAEKAFDTNFLQALDIDVNMFSKAMPTGSVVGKFSKEISAELGVKDCTLVLGSHDQICATLGAGVVSAGQAVDGMGTVECITAVFDKKPTDVNMGLQGYPIVPFAVGGLYCTYILNYSNASIVNWFKNNIMHGFKGDKDSYFAYIENDIDDNPSGILVLPYFGGAATPFQNINAKGAVVNLTSQTTDIDFFHAILEGTAMEMRFNAEIVKKYGITIKSAVATGGGANSVKWLKIKADIQNISYKTLRSSEGGLCGCALLQAVAMGQVKSLADATKIFVKYKKQINPEKAVHDKYINQYKKYKKLYKTIKELY